MSLLIKGGGITKLSELIIDVDKDWGNKRILQLPEPVDGAEPAVKAMTIGSKPPVGNTKIQNLYINPTDKELVSEVG